MSSVDDVGMAGFDESGGTGGSGGRKKLLIIIAAAVILLGGAGGAAYMFLLGGTPAEGEHAEEVEAEELPPPVFYDMPEIVIRLDGGQGPYLKLATVLDLASEHSVEEIKAVEPRLLDAMQTYLIELKPEDIKGTAGMYRMRQELLRRINDALPGSTRDVLFKTLILQ
jgi:flagellar protein FliL